MAAAVITKGPVGRSHHRALPRIRHPPGPPVIGSLVSLVLVARGLRAVAETLASIAPLEVIVSARPRFRPDDVGACSPPARVWPARPLAT